VAGNWTPDPYGAFPGIAAGGTDIVCCNDVVLKYLMHKVMATREEIIKGTKQIFGGPLADRDGNERVAAGKVPDDGSLWKMDWNVKGVVSSR
jgi:basic membrane protein A and related proteins